MPYSPRRERRTSRRPHLTLVPGGLAESPGSGVTGGQVPASPKPFLVSVQRRDRRYQVPPSRPRAGGRLATLAVDLLAAALAWGTWLDGDWGGLFALGLTYLSLALILNLHGLAGTLGLQHRSPWMRLGTTLLALSSLAGLVWWLGPWLDAP